MKQIANLYNDPTDKDIRNFEQAQRIAVETVETIKNILTVDKNQEALEYIFVDNDPSHVLAQTGKQIFETLRFTLSHAIYRYSIKQERSSFLLCQKRSYYGSKEKRLEYNIDDNEFITHTGAQYTIRILVFFQLAHVAFGSKHMEINGSAKISHWSDYDSNTPGFMTRIRMYAPEYWYLDMKTYPKTFPGICVKREKDDDDKITEIEIGGYRAREMAKVNRGSVLYNYKVSYWGKDTSYKRIFNGDEDKGGRMSASFQNMPREARRKLLKHHTGHHDFTNAHAACLAAIATGEPLTYDIHLAFGKKYGYIHEGMTPEQQNTMRKVIKGSNTPLINMGNSDKKSKLNIIATNHNEYGLHFPIKYKGKIKTKFDSKLYTEIHESLEQVILNGDLSQIQHLKDYTTLVSQDLLDKNDRSASSKMHYAIKKLKDRNRPLYLTKDLDTKFCKASVRKDDFNDKTKTLNSLVRHEFKDKKIYYDGVTDLSYSEITANVISESAVNFAYRTIKTREEKGLNNPAIPFIDPHIYLEQFNEFYALMLETMKTFSSLDYQNIESEIAIEVMLYFRAKKVGILNFHDGFYIDKRYEEELKDIMNYFLYKRLFIYMMDLLKKDPGILERVVKFFKIVKGILNNISSERAHLVREYPVLMSYSEVLGIIRSDTDDPIEISEKVA